MELPDASVPENRSPSNEMLCGWIAAVLTQTLGQLHPTDFSAYISNYANNGNGTISEKNGLNEAGFKAAVFATLNMLGAMYGFSFTRLVSEHTVKTHDAYVDVLVERDGHPRLILELKLVSPSYFDILGQPSGFGAELGLHSSGTRRNRQMKAFRAYCAQAAAGSEDMLEHIEKVVVFMSTPGASRRGLNASQHKMTVREFMDAAVANQLSDYLAIEHQRHPDAALDGAVIIGVGDQVFVHGFQHRGGAATDDGVDAITRELAALSTDDTTKEEEKKNDD